MISCFCFYDDNHYYFVVIVVVVAVAFVDVALVINHRNAAPEYLRMYCICKTSDNINE